MLFVSLYVTCGCGSSLCNHGSSPFASMEYQCNHTVPSFIRAFSTLCSNTFLNLGVWLSCAMQHFMYESITLWSVQCIIYLSLFWTQDLDTMFEIKCRIVQKSNSSEASSMMSNFSLFSFKLFFVLFFVLFYFQSYLSLITFTLLFFLLYTWL